MEKQKFETDEENKIIGVEKEKTITQEDFYFSGMYFNVLITDEGEYFNIYVIDEQFKQYPINCLKLQEPKADLVNNENEFNLDNPEKYFNSMRLECWALEHYLWSKYNKSFGIEYSQE